uniref:Uncharacterized protein n=1 Tax=Candidatus Kentrum eta TaxID=2126337 RepID=A0A450V5G5_9GAMM|nr:MAG: hypothetical protein BECKH772A_GA0070896_1004014 [Candidatus Kentron sp. H]VFJ93154.1 MAG: hypothetical protein BECKH772B_GA0070898_1003914 [Candidatus Kentron sp. H]VFK00006.1 MAG: hypothetical protein BECKH772C_GA0070978_1003814 [Candidatus Kentron sp. H]
MFSGKKTFRLLSTDLSLFTGVLHKTAGSLPWIAISRARSFSNDLSIAVPMRTCFNRFMEVLPDFLLPIPKTLTAYGLTANCAGMWKKILWSKSQTQD